MGQCTPCWIVLITWIATKINIAITYRRFQRVRAIGDLIARWPWESSKRSKRTVVRPTDAPPGKFTTLKELLVNAPPEDIVVLPAVHETERVAGSALERAVRTRGIYQKLSFAWFAKTPEALAYCELFQSWAARATKRQCRCCQSLFLRPNAVDGTLCPICRLLNWRQRKKIGSRPRERRPRFAIQLYAKQLRAPGWGSPQVVEEVQ